LFLPSPSRGETQEVMLRKVQRLKLTCEVLNHSFKIPEHLERVVCLTSGLTEAIFAMGCGNLVAGVSAYCSRYVSDLKAPVVGDYLTIDQERLAVLEPDLVLVTTGVQLKLARRLARMGLPVYALPLPNSFHGVLDNIILLGGLLDRMSDARNLVKLMTTESAEITGAAPGYRPRVYVELWFGRHRRSIGGRTFIHDIVSIAGGDPIFRHCVNAYPSPDPAEILGLKPEIAIFFQEPEFPIDIPSLVRERGWSKIFGSRIIESTIIRGRNLIHDGPSLIETTRWLQGEIRRCLIGYSQEPVNTEGETL
jgi:ABC-type Fe3+-hydroxamate transport system substrate-binding protein